MSDEVKKESHIFQAEIIKVLDILAKSLYTNKEVFIRELISNAADAISKVRLNLLTDKELEGKELPLEINLELDKDSNTITISDTGIGMTRDELIENIGTIAHSGTGDFLQKLAEASKNKDTDIIGQFGVGFYSVFMVAKKVTLTTKSATPGEEAWEWESDGSGSYTLAPAEKKDRGTSIKIYLDEEAKDFTEEFRVKSVIQKYSNFIPYPIKLKDETLNKVTAIWREQKSSIKEEDYNEFYKFLTNFQDDPFLHIHFSADAPIQFHTIFYVPKKNYDFFKMGHQDYGLDLYSNKVLIQKDCKDLLPEYLRFIKGVVDSEDIPLNVSRETIQDDRKILTIKTNITSRFINTLTEMAENEEERYNEFWNEFGRFIKEGINMDFNNRDKLSKLLRFSTSKDTTGKKLISLNEYIENMQVDQTEIYYICGNDRESVEKSPHLEAFKKNDVEVLYLYDPMDDFAMSSLGTYEGKNIKSIDSGDLDFIKNKPADIVDTSEEPKDYQSKFEKFIDFMKKTLGDKVIDIIESKRLTDSPVCLVNPENSPSTHVQKLLKMMDQNYAVGKKIFEINRKHEIVKNLAEIYDRKPDAPLLTDYINQLYENALMMEGIVSDPSQIVVRMNKILNDAVELKSEKYGKIIT